MDKQELNSDHIPDSQNENVTIVDNSFEVSFGSNDTTFIPNFLSQDEIKEVFDKLNENEYAIFQQWYHMPNKKNILLPLSRLKFAVTEEIDKNGWQPHYRFPVNNQNNHEVFPFSKLPIIEKIKNKLIERIGIQFNHAVVLLYRDGNDCIGFHKDKTLDLSDTDPIASISIGQERTYILQNNIHNPTATQKINLSNGGLLLLGSKTNQEWYHSVPSDPTLQNNTNVRISLTFRVVRTFKNANTNEIKGKGGIYQNLNWPEELDGHHTENYQEILDFWLGENKGIGYDSLWWLGIHPKIPELREINKTDEYIKSRWGDLLNIFYEKKYNILEDDHVLKPWFDVNSNGYDGIVSAIILFDQFPRNAYRGESKSLAFDDYALDLAQYLMQKPNIPFQYKYFACVAMMHSENIDIVANTSFEVTKLAEIEEHYWDKIIKNTSRVVADHLAVLRKFGRYPHRNHLLNREYTNEEYDLLTSKNLPKWMKSVKLPKLLKTVEKDKPLDSVPLSSKTKNDKADQELAGDKKLKILVLHSNRQTGQSFRAKTRLLLENKLKSFAKLTYCDAPEKYNPQGEAMDTIVSHQYSDVPNVGYTRAWWNASDDPSSMIYRGIEQSVKYIDDLFGNDEYDGIIGFSQGGALAGIIASLVYNKKQGKTHSLNVDHISKTLKFVTIISGFYCRDIRMEVSKLMFDNFPAKHEQSFVTMKKDKVDIPSFHVWGLTDDLVHPWRSQKLSELFNDPVIQLHNYGHFAKAIQHWPIDQLKEWLQQFVTEKSVPNYHDMLLNIAGKSNGNNDMLYKLIKQTLNETQSFWTYLIEYEYVNEGMIYLMNVVVKIACDQLHDEYIRYHVNREFGMPTKLSVYISNAERVSKKHDILKHISLHLGTMINIFNENSDKIREFGDDDKDNMKLCYKQYKEIIKTLTKFHFPEELPNVTKKHIQTDLDLKRMLSKPLSEHIINPKAQPVDVTPPEVFIPLYNFLKNSEIVCDTSDIIFPKGTVCKDGRLDLCKQVIGPVGINGLLESLMIDSTSGNPKVKNLLLGNNICGNELGKQVGKFIESGKSAMISWYIAGNNLDKDGIEPVCKALQNDNQVKQLWLKRNPLKLNGIYPIINMLKYNTCLEVLDLTNTGILDEGAIMLLQNMSISAQTIKYLYLSSNGLTMETCKTISEHLHKTNVMQIGLGCNRLGDDGAKFLALELKHPECKLNMIEISSCGIGKNGMKYIADSLKINKTLVKLNAGFMKSTIDLDEVQNYIESDGAIYLAESLKINNTIRDIDIVYTGVKQSGIKALEEALMQNDKIIKLNLEQFGVPHNELSREMIRSKLKINASKLSKEDMTEIDEILNPQHLEEIKSVYRIQ